MHLVAGLVAGISIAIMCVTGVALAFEKQIVAWAERDVRLANPAALPGKAGTPPAKVATPLALDELQRRFATAHPDAKPAAITISSDPHAAVVFSIGREGAYYINPYTGGIRQPATTRMHDFMHVMTDWHRVLALSGDNRPIGKMINGVCNLAFFFLAVSGLYIWWPRRLSWRSLKALAVFNWRLAGKARDFNWHNSIGFWSAPVLIVLTLTAVPISFRWGGNLIYRIAGEEPPAAQGRGAFATPAIKIEKPSADARPLERDELLAIVQQEFPAWQEISLRLGGGTPSRGSAAGGARRSAAAGEAAQAISFTIKEPGSWPRTASATAALDPFTGGILRRDGFGDLSTARQIRSWMRFLHTGEALGWGGQLVAGLACLGGCFLVYTGFALSWRRFFGKTRRPRTSARSAREDSRETAEVGASD